MDTHRDDDNRLVIERLPHGGFVVYAFVGAHPLFASTDIETALRFIREHLKEDG